MMPTSETPRPSLCITTPWESSWTEMARAREKMPRKTGMNGFMPGRARTSLTPTEKPLLRER